jgi:hypothetical protein
MDLFAASTFDTHPSLMQPVGAELAWIGSVANKFLPLPLSQSLGSTAMNYLESQIIPFAKLALAQFAATSKPSDALHQAFGNNFNDQELDILINGFVNCDQLPTIKVVPFADLQADGAFGNNTIFLSEDILINHGNLDRSVSVFLEELGHYIDSKVNREDSRGDEGAIFSRLVLNQPLASGELEDLYAEADHGILTTIDAQRLAQHIAVEYSTAPGVFVVGAAGQVTIDFLADAGAYRSEMAIFSLSGMEGLSPGSDAYIKEAARRALTNSSLGSVVLRDSIEGARFTGELGEINQNEGSHAAPKSFQFNVGDQLAFMLVPRGTVQDVYTNPSINKSKRPLFSISAANPNATAQFGNLVAGVFSWEDLRSDQDTDRDYNDIVFQVRGATGKAPDLGSLIAAGKDWRNSPTAQEIIRFALESNFPPPSPSTPGSGDNPTPPSPSTPGSGDNPTPPSPSTPGSGDNPSPPTIDTLPPILSIISLEKNDVLPIGSRLQGNLDGTGSSISKFSYRFTGGPEIDVEINSQGYFDQVIDSIGINPGAQELLFTAVDSSGNVTQAVFPVVLLAPGSPFFANQLTSKQDSVFLGDTTEISFNISVANPKGVKEILLYEVSEAGVMILLGSLYDDGDLDKDDDISGDGSYSNKFIITPAVEGKKEYIAIIPDTQQKSAEVFIDVISPLTDEQFQAILDFNAQIEDIFTNLLKTGTVSESLAAVEAVLTASPNRVKTSSIEITDQSILWESLEGIVSFFNANVYLNGQRAGENSDSAVFDASSLQASAATAPQDEACNKALVLAPYAFQFEPFDEANEIAQKLRDADFSVVEKANTNVSVQDFKNLQQYKAIAISSHGDNFDGKNFGNGNEIVLFTGQKANLLNKLFNIADLLTKRLVLAGDTYAVTSSFISKYTDKMPDSIVYISSCRSTRTKSLANAFLYDGAKAFIGFSDYVNPEFAFPRGQLVFDTLLQGKMTGDIPGINSDQETDTDPALFQLIGSNKAILSDTQLQNGDFEKGDFRCWMKDGDARIITALGPLSPPDGNRMAIISTGLGSVSESVSSISTSFMVSDNADKLQLTYNVISEEPLEFVGSKFDDRFEILLNGIVVAGESVNASQWSPIGGIDFAGGDTTMFETGFKTINLDLSAYIGKKVSFKLSVFDKGDSIYDTAALVDAIKVVLK